MPPDFLPQPGIHGLRYYVLYLGSSSFGMLKPQFFPLNYDVSWKCHDQAAAKTTMPQMNLSYFI